MSVPHEEHQLVFNLGHHMLQKLRKNHYKPHWSNLTIVEARDRLIDELGELMSSIERFDDPQKVWEEAADVANFAAFMAENFEKSNSWEPRDSIEHERDT